MSISLSSGFSSQFSQTHTFPDRQNYGRNSVTDKVHEFSKDQMEHLITSMDMMSKDIRSHLLDLQTMPGATNAYSQLQPKTEQFESIVEDKIRSSFQRLSPVIMQGNLYSETVEPYHSTSEWKQQTSPSPSPASPRELHPIIIGERYPERSEYKFCNPSNVTKEAESNMQPQTNSERCRHRLLFERDAEGNIGSKNVNSFTKYDDSYKNQTPDTNELDGSHFAACLDQGLKKSFSKEKSYNASSVKRNGSFGTSMAPGANSKCVGTELVESEEKQEEPTDSNHNIILKDLVSQAAQLLDNNDSDLNIDTDSMVDSLWSEIKEAFNHNIEKVFKDVNTSEFLSKLSQDASYSKMSAREKKSPKVSNADTDESDISVCEKNPEGYEKNKEDDDMVDDALPLPSASSSASTSSAEDSCFDYSSRKSRSAKQSRCEKVKDKMLWNSHRKRRNKKKEQDEEEEEQEVDEEEEEEERCFSRFISGGILNQKRGNFEQLQHRKNYVSDQDQRHHHKHKGENYDEYADARFQFLYDVDTYNDTEEFFDRSSDQYFHSNGHQKHKQHLLKNGRNDKKSRGVHFSNTVHLIEVTDGDVIESKILMPEGKIDFHNREMIRTGNYFNERLADDNPYQKPNKKWTNVPDSFYNLRQEADFSREPVTANQERSMRDKSVMTFSDVPTSNPASCSVSAWTKEAWNEPLSPRTRTENWKCNSRVEDEQNGIFKTLTIESVSTDKTSPPNLWLEGGKFPTHRKQELSENPTEPKEEAHTKRYGNDENKENSQSKEIPDHNISSERRHNALESQSFDQAQSNVKCQEKSTETQTAFVCCVLPQNICNSVNRNIETYENVYISNMMLNDLKGEDLKNPCKIGQPIEPSEAKKVSYLVRELMEHLHANETMPTKEHSTDKGLAAGSRSSAPEKISWTDTVNSGKRSTSPLSECGSPILFCYLPPEFLPEAHQIKSLKKPSKYPRKTIETNLSTRDKSIKKSPPLHKGCQTENNNNNRNQNSRCNSVDNQGEGFSWWISAPPRVKKKQSSRIQQIYSSKLPPPVSLTVKSISKGSRLSPPERMSKTMLSPCNKKPTIGVGMTKRKPFIT